MNEEFPPNSVIVDESSITKVYTKTFLFMFLGLLATGIISWYTYSSGLFIDIIKGNTFEILLLVEVLFVLIFSATLRKLPAFLVQILFFVYAILNGVTLSVIFFIYSINSITMVFIASAVLFGAFAFYGYITKADLSKIAPILFGALLIGVIVTFINIFMGNELLDIIFSWVILIIFFGVTAYDMQKIKRLAMSNEMELDKLYIYGAMELYLDFINIFLRILRIFGKRR